MNKISIILLTLIFLNSSVYPLTDEERVKILNREKELLEMEKNMYIEFNERKNTILSNTNECLQRAKTKKEIRDCNKYKKDEMEFLNKEMKYRREQLANDKKQLAEDKKKLRSKRRKK